MIINKQATFVVRMARNLKNKSPEARTEILAQMDPKVTKLVNAALRVMNEKKRSNT